MNQTTPGTLDIKILAILGLIVMILFVSTPILAIGYFAKEVQRKQECATRSSLDTNCQPSRVWKWMDIFQGAMQVQALQGEEGDPCAGPLETRCKPGFECRGGSETQLGVCQAFTEPIPSATGTKK